MTKSEIYREVTGLKLKQLSLQATMRKSDAHASKCAKLGVVFADTYPDDYTAYVAANEAYNANEAAIAALEALYETAEDEMPEETWAEKEQL